MGPASDSVTDTDTDVEIIDTVPSTRDKGKRNAGEKVEWSDSEDENVYEKVGYISFAILLCGHC